MAPFDDDDDDFDNVRRPSVPFPGGVKAAGILWIVFGVLALISYVLSFALTAGAQERPGSNPGGLSCGMLFAVVFLVIGFQTLQGTAKGTLANGIGSIVFGLLY